MSCFTTHFVLFLLCVFNLSFVAFGLPVKHLSFESIKNGFKELFFQMIHQYSTRLIAQIPQTMIQRLPRSKIFFLDRNKRYGILEKLMNQQPYLYEDPLLAFSNTWTNSLLNSVVQEAFKAIMTGRVLGSVLYVVRTSLRFLLGPLVAQFLKTIVSNYAIESLLELSEDSPLTEAKKKIARSVLQLLSPTPTLDVSVEKLLFTVNHLLQQMIHCEEQFFNSVLILQYTSHGQRT